MSCRDGDIAVYPRACVLPSVEPMRNHTAEATTTTAPDATTSPPDPTDLPARRGTAGRRASVAGRRASVVAGAGAAALLTWLVAGPVLGINLEVLKTPGATTPVAVTAGSVLVSAVVAGLSGWAALAVLERVSVRGTTLWRWIATTVALLSLAGPLTLAQDTGGAVVLVLLHLVVAAVLLVALPAQRSD